MPPPRHGTEPSNAAVNRALLAPVVEKLQQREPPPDPLAPEKARSADNLARLVTALHGYHDKHREFPPATHSRVGKPLLSRCHF